MIIAIGISVILSILLAYLGTCFQMSYLKEKEFTLKNVLPAESPYFILSLLCYIVFLILGIVFYPQKEMTYVQMAEAVFFWYGLFLVSWTDLKVRKIPNAVLKFLMIGKLFSIVLLILVDHQSWKIAFLSAFLGLVISGISVLFCKIVSKGQIGAGDVKLYALTGFYLGVAGFINIMIYSIFLAGVFSILTLLFNAVRYRKKLSEAMKTTIPMAPFIFLGLTLYLIFL